MGILRLWLRRGHRGIAVAAVALASIVILAARPAYAGYASIVVDAGSGKVLNEVNADQVNHPASLTKMMTLYLAFDALKKGKLHWDQMLPVSRWAASKSPTKLYLRPGSEVSVRDCVLGMIVLSANDAATVMAEALGGTESHFAEMMTAKAHALGMASTNYVNASGLPDEDQVTTARDLVKLAMALHDDFPDDYHFFSTREFLFHGREIHGHNRLMYRYDGMDGMKTGFTNASGFNLASSAVRDGRRLYGIVLGGMSAPARDRLMATLLDNAFANRDTSPILVAEAAGQSARTARRIFAAADHVAARLSPVSTAEAAPLPARTRHVGHVVEATSRGLWSVQVGAYSHERQATHAARRAVELAGLGDHKTEILPPSRHERVYRARLDGFGTERQARAACATLHHKGKGCMVVAPSHGGVRLAGNRD